MDGEKSGPEEPRNVLRAKYHDYCSAQVADLLVYMSPDEIYLLAHRAYREEGRTDEVSYADMVKVATDWLAERIALPPFEVWVEDYRKHPQRYEEYFMGLWESELREEGEGDGDEDRDK
ncbi:MAG: hypothetical protein R3253_07295 [Longimicrobiales bacterium]|nr:hypothetical protein [Longimicrobiales bacterium]